MAALVISPYQKATSPHTHTSEIDNSPITAQGIEGKATDGRYSGDYTLGFFGPDADEIVGSVELGDEDVIGIFGGTKKAK